MSILRRFDCVLESTKEAVLQKNEQFKALNEDAKGVCRCILNQNAVILRVSNKIICNDYLFYFINTNNCRGYLDLNAHGTANQASLPLKDILDFNIYFPNIEQQKQIVNYIDTKTSEIDELSKNLKSQANRLHKYKQSLISEAVTGKIDVRELS